MNVQSIITCGLSLNNVNKDEVLDQIPIHCLSATYGRTIYAAEIEGDLRSLFYLDGETVVSLVVGTHDIYKG